MNIKVWSLTWNGATYLCTNRKEAFDMQTSTGAVIIEHDLEIGRLAVVVGGGLVQGVAGTGALVGMPLYVIDHDTEGAEEGSTVPVQFFHATAEQAYVREHEAESADIDFDQLDKSIKLNEESNG